MSKIQELANQINELKAKMKKEGQAAMKEAFKDFFGDHPAAKAVVWAEYTPYFNDGDACTFSLREFELKVHLDKLSEKTASKFKKHLDKYDYLDDDQHSMDYSYGDSCFAYLEAESLTAEEAKMVSDFKALKRDLYSIKDVLEDVFGDHAKITATPEGFAVAEYDHD